jgi:sugar lactone lactonase YvrE
MPSKMINRRGSKEMDKKIAALLVIALACAAPIVAQHPSYEELYRQSYAQYQAKNYPAMLDTLKTMNALRPNHPSVLTALVSAFALNGRPDDALNVMARLMAMKVWFNTADSDFESLRTNARFLTMAREIDGLRNERVGNAVVAFRIPERDLITEGMAFDPSRRSFFVSSARKGKIVRIDRNGKVSDFASAGGHGLSGIGIDSRRRILWACSTASERNADFHKGDPSDAALVAFDLRTGAVVRQVKPADAAVFCDDLSVAADGTVFVSDSTGSILRLTPGSDQLETLVPRGRIRSPQGSALSADQKRLYVADYGGAIRAVDVETGDVVPLRMPDDFQTMGIDGLTRYGHSLIAVQNGIVPNRIVRLDLASGGLAVSHVRILAMNPPLMDEPTIGKVVGSDYYFVGASQGNKFDRGTPDPKSLQPGIIFRIALP